MKILSSIDKRSPQIVADNEFKVYSIERLSANLSTPFDHKKAPQASSQGD